MTPHDRLAGIDLRVSFAAGRERSASEVTDRISQIVGGLASEKARLIEENVEGAMEERETALIRLLAPLRFSPRSGYPFHVPRFALGETDSPVWSGQIMSKDNVPQHAAEIWMRSPINEAFKLTEAEQRVLGILVSGAEDNRSIAKTLIISQSTVKTYIERSLAKLDVRTRTQAAVRVVSTGLLFLVE